MRNFGRKYQGGWVQLVAAAISAAAAAKAASDARRQRLAEQQRAEQVRAEDIALQNQIRQTSIQERVADARAAGLHPLYALGAAPASYQPVGLQTFSHSAPHWGSAVARFSQQVADYMSQRANRDSGELMGPPHSAFYEDPVATTWSVADQSPEISSTLHPDSPQASEFGIVTAAPKPSMARWAVPGIGVVIAPDASNFSESLEGLESPIGQGLIFYLNRNLGDRALAYLQSKMPTLNDAKKWTIDGLIDLGSRVAGQLGKVNDFSMGR